MSKNRKVSIFALFFVWKQKKEQNAHFSVYYSFLFKKKFFYTNNLTFLCTFTFRVSRRGCVIKFITILWMRNKDFKGKLFVYTILGRIISFYEIVKIKVQFSIYIYTSHKLYLLYRAFIITLEIMKALMRSYFSHLK